MIWGHPHFTTPPSIIIIQHDHGLLEIPTYSFKSIIADCSSVKSSSYASMSYDRHPRPVFQVVSKSPVASCFNFRIKSHFLESDHKPRDQGHSPRGPRFQGWYAFVSLSTLLMSLTLVQVAMKAALHNGLPYPYTLTAPGWHCRLFSWGCDHI